ncbi:TetR/AcrR family transcriptional regulator [Antrihabitans sp. YC2-6]|uniref:TetR/AcrR family transcriptional regulator n=1 Tax=Antrihabitans sp. YC2-6 TaxID=2799498 RepID=UPI0018F3215C|nr:TetR/AcrR family transcriptional regulator [Antrihabitans sp. YC2-6]MBJ8346092.1 TetR/AcrR family transcriptional regulator [Antrihabitans sp. YC2-6]
MAVQRTRPLKRDRSAAVEAVRARLGARDPATVRMRDVARVLGVPVTGVYKYFDSIDDVRTALGAPVRVAPLASKVDAAQAFSETFIARAAGPEHIKQVVAELLGDTLEIGPMPVGPKSARAVASAIGKIGDIDVRRTGGPSSMMVTVPVAVDVDVRVGRNYRRKFSATVSMPVKVDIAPTANLQLKVETKKPRRTDIAVSVDVYGLSLKLMRRIGRVDELLRTHSLDYLDKVLNSPEGRAATTIDLGRVIDEAWKRGLVLP